MVIEEIKVDSLVMLLEEIDRLPQEEFFCFRGQSNASWGLVPSVFRGLSDIHPPLDWNELVSILQAERDIYRLFFDKAVRLIQGKSKWEALIYAQHYGTPTRLLDWSHNVLAGLFFAVTENSDQDGAVWCLNVSRISIPPMFGRRLDKRGLRINLLPTHDLSFLQELSRPPGIPAATPSFLAVVQPPDIDDRVKNQGSLFSVYLSFGGDNPDECVFDQLDYLRGLERPDGSPLLRKIIIPKDKKSDFIKGLERTGISSEHIYPDLIGLGQHLSRLRIEMIRRAIQSRNVRSIDITV